ncbi:MULTISPECIES: cell filamentation protein Fic [Atlantibacter]|uniref:Fic family protein n=1 Tax=Atlantibacter TaxID=1903434 RepID=UPI00181E5C30|nr:cell filamentation protein Fic [Atlantibacter sp.]MBB3322856.1 Fic family protein [Atlantibacter sp. RC6]
MSTHSSTPLGFSWDASVLPAVTPGTTRRALAIYQQQLASFVWDAAKLENNPFTFVEVQTLLDGVTVGGHKLSDAEQVTNLADSSKKLVELVKNGRFDLDKPTFILLHTIVARNEALEWGVFRKEGEETSYSPYVALGEQGEHHPLPTVAGAAELNRVYAEGVAFIKTLPPFEGALVMFLFGALQQFFFDGNKRTSRHMMNGWLMKHGFDPISVPAARAQEFNDRMVNFYVGKDATAMLVFLNSCRRS